MSETLYSLITGSFDKTEFTKLNWRGTFKEYLEIVQNNPIVVANAWRRMYEMIMSKGTAEKVRFKKKLIQYKFFSEDPKNPIYGLEEALMEFVDTIHAGAKGYGPEKRVLLFHGPVGSSKSTICSLLKRGLEEYTRTDAGAIYTYDWNLEGTDLEQTEGKIVPSSIHEDPLNVLPNEIRNQIMAQLSAKIDGGLHFNPNHALNPRCQFYFNHLLNMFNGDIEKVLDRVVIRRLVFNEKERVGVGTFQPKDEKNQDSTELTGDINFRKLGQIGTDSDPRCFNFDGEFQVANRGMCEFIEVLKLSKEFLYDLLGASQENQVKPKKFAQMSIDEVIIGHTNATEFMKLQKDKSMEALRDRTIKIDVPYLLIWDDEEKIYEHSYNPNTVKQHIAPHTLRIAALWSILTRLKEAKDRSVSLVEKAKLYNGQALPGWTEDKVREMRENSTDEGLDGISARFVQNTISNILVNHKDCISPFMVLREFKERLDSCSLIDNEDDRKHYKDLIEVVTKEFDEIVKDEIQRALVGNEEAIKELCTQYIDNVVASVNKMKITNPITQREEEPNERLMREIEEKIGIAEQAVGDFRRTIVVMIGSMAREAKEFRYDSNQKLYTALKLKLFEDTKDTIKLAKLSFGAGTVDPTTQDRIDLLKKRLKEHYGYCDHCAADILQYASSIFARGDIVKS